MKRILASLMAVVMLLSLCTFPAYAAEDDVTLTVTPSITEATAGTDAINVIYTVTITPKAGVAVGAAAFHFTVPEGMTLAENKLGKALANKGGNGYWIAAKELQLTEDEDTGAETGIFNTFEYAHASKYFCAAGASATRNLTSEAVVMTIKATIEAGRAGDFTLSTNDFKVSDPLGNEISGTKVTATTVTVKAATVAVTGVTISPATLSLDLKNNTTGTLTATVEPSNATDKAVTWSSNDDSVATVDQNGKVTAVAVGEATITATAGDQAATCTVTVVNCDHSYTAQIQKAEAVKTPGTCMTEAVYYYSCEYCGMVENNDSHTFKGEKDLDNHSYTVKNTTNSEALMTAGTCTTEAVYYYSCACGAVEKNADHTFTGAKDLNNHSYTAQTQKAEAVMTPGNCTTETVYYYSCSRCGEVEKNAAHTFEGAVDNTKHDYTKQTKSEATCYKLGTCTAEAEYYYSCSRCDEVEADVNHTFKGDKDSNNHAGSTKNIQYDENQHWWLCEGCGKQAGAKADHSSTGSNVATCTKLAKCDVCSQTYGALVPHSVTKVEAKEPTCTTDGNKEHWTCGSCNKLFSDAEGNTETNAAAVTIKALGHDMTKTEAKAATCTEAGNNEYYTCSRCNKVFEDADGKTETTVDAEKINALGHTMTKTEAVAPTCTEGGNNEYYTCSNCGDMFKDEAGTTPTNAEAEKIEPLGHDYGTQIAKVPATCTKEGTAAHYQCNRCKELFLDTTSGNAVTASDLVLKKIAHNYSTDYAYTGTEHWQFCTACGATTNKAAHDFTVDETTGTKTCQTCGYVVHTVDAGDDHVCIPVNNWSFDDNNHWHICEGCNKKCNEAAHDIDWVIDVEATATTDGLRHGKCKVCGYVKQEVITKPTTPDRPNHRPSGGSSATSSDKVQSSKTFDAGIAAYVGLSVLSLTGSALVIGKKKEF